MIHFRRMKSTEFWKRGFFLLRAALAGGEVCRLRNQELNERQFRDNSNSWRENKVRAKNEEGILR